MSFSFEQEIRNIFNREILSLEEKYSQLFIMAFSLIIFEF